MTERLVESPAGEQRLQMRGRNVGGRDHTTVLHAWRRVELGDVIGEDLHGSRRIGYMKLPTTTTA